MQVKPLWASSHLKQKHAFKSQYNSSLATCGLTYKFLGRSLNFSFQPSKMSSVCFEFSIDFTYHLLFALEPGRQTWCLTAIFLQAVG